MKKMITTIMVLGLMVCVGGCQLPWKKTSDSKQEAKKTPIATETIENTMTNLKFTVGVSNEMAPFSYYDQEQKQVVGFDIDLLDELSDYLGFRYEIKPMPMRDIIKGLKSKKIDFAIAAISITDERQKEFSFTDPYYENSIELVVNQNTQITDRDQMTNKTIGVEKGTSSAKYAKDYLADDNTVREYANMPRVFDDLEKGKIDATLYDTTGVREYLKEHKTTNLTALDEELNTEESNYGIMFLKGNQYVERFNVALQVLSGQGDLQKLKERWIGLN